MKKEECSFLLSGSFAVLIFLQASLAPGRVLSWPLFSGHAFPAVLSGETQEEKTRVVAVPGNSPWTDTGLDVRAGQEVFFRATGKITLQVGHPDADCSPAGYNLQTVQQPLRGENLGALIGKVVISVKVTVDEETGEEKREEVAEIFFIGDEKLVEMPAAGRLFLGINEDVTGDNGGQFLVTITTKG